MNRYLAGFALLGFLALPSSAQVPGMFQPLLAGAALPVIGTPVNIGTTNASSTGVSYTITTTANILAGDALVFSGLSYRSGGAFNILSISDGTNSYTFSSNRQVFGNQTVENWYVCGATAISSGATITVTFAGVNTAWNSSVSRISGIKASSCLDVAPAGSTGTSTSGTVSTGTLAQSNEIIFGNAGVNNCPTYTEASGFTTSNSGSVCNAFGLTMSQAYKTVSATTTTAFAPSWSSSQLYGLLVISLKGF